ncbi:MAG: hydroxyacid dehydrogenase [Myxococcales bacterium]|nr:hydroxyacid dehydrogenase [Myxococcales bacterium]
MRVLIADKFSAEGKANLASMGLHIIDRPDLGAHDLPAALERSKADVLIVRSTEVTAESFAQGTELSLVIRAGAGVNTIDLAAASQHGVFVANTPGKNAIAVAELTMGFILALDRSIPDAVAELRSGRWDKKRFGKARGLCGRHLGLVGFGAIAREVATRAQAFGMVVHAFDVVLTDGIAHDHDVIRATTLDEVLRDSDVVSVHVPYIAGRTHHLIGEAELAVMKDGACLVHTARGGVVDDTALAAVVASGRIRAALDVFEGEPDAGQADWRSPLLEGPGVYGTPHIGASTDQASDAIAQEVVRIIADYRDQGVVHHCVNIQRTRGEGCTVVIRHLDRVGVLAGVLDAFQKEQLNVQQMHNVIFDGNAAASATISLAREPSPELVERIRARDDVIAVSVRSSASR